MTLSTPKLTPAQTELLSRMKQSATHEEAWVRNAQGLRALDSNVIQALLRKGVLQHNPAHTDAQGFIVYGTPTYIIAEGF